MEETFMKEALKEAKKAYKKGEVPVGAVIVKNGEEFIFEISKINIYDSNEVIYLKKIVDHLDFLVQSYNKKCYK